MRTSSILLLALASFVVAGCAFAHPAAGTSDPEPIPAEPVLVPGEPVVPGVRPMAPPVVESHLESCLVGGGHLVEVDAVNNNDSSDHGELVTLAVGDDGVIVAGGADGTLKFWTLEGDLRGTATSAFLGYGIEIGAAPSSDLAFLGSRIVSGDIGGLVTAFAESGEFEVLGGTSPGIVIESVAVDAAGTRVAYADAQATGNVIIRPIGGGDVVGPLPTTLARVGDLAFLPDGRLVLGGSLAEEFYASFELRDAADPTVTVASFHLEGGARIAEVAVARNGSAIAGVAGDILVAFDGNLGAATFALHPDHLAASAAYTPNGSVLLTAGGDGTVRAWTRSADGAGEALHELDRVAVSAPVAVRIDRTGTLAFAGSRDGIIHVLSCER